MPQPADCGPVRDSGEIVTDAEAIHCEKLAYKFTYTIKPWPANIGRDDFVQDVLMKLLRGKFVYGQVGWENYLARTCWSMLGRAVSRRLPERTVREFPDAAPLDWKQWFRDEDQPLIEAMFLSGRDKREIASSLGIGRTAVYNRVAKILRTAREAAA